MMLMNIAMEEGKECQLEEWKQQNPHLADQYQKQQENQDQYSQSILSTLEEAATTSKSLSSMERVGMLMVWYNNYLNNGRKGQSTISIPQLGMFIVNLYINHGNLRALLDN